MQLLMYVDFSSAAFTVVIQVLTLGCLGGVEGEDIGQVNGLACLTFFRPKEPAGRF